VGETITGRPATRRLSRFTRLIKTRFTVSGGIGFPLTRLLRIGAGGSDLRGRLCLSALAADFREVLPKNTRHFLWVFLLVNLLECFPDGRALRATAGVDNYRKSVRARCS
jgi:hypothetical protein